MSDDENGILNPPSRRGLQRPEPIEPFGGIGRSTTKTETEIKFPFMVLVCNDCNEYYEHNGDWNHCPKCGTDLVEVEQA